MNRNLCNRKLVMSFVHKSLRTYTSAVFCSLLHLTPKYFPRHSGICPFKRPNFNPPYKTTGNITLVLILEFLKLKFQNLMCS
jgi:hypothetical protein